MADADSSEKQPVGEKLLTAVERLVASTDELIAGVDRLRQEASRQNIDTAAIRKKVAAQLISQYSRNSAISGGLAAAPALVPGIGTIVSLVGGTLADMALMLKFEVELALCLTWLYGYDIRGTRERQLAFMLASVSTYGAKTKRNFFVDVAAAEGEAIWNYTPRQLSKGLISVMTKIALLSLSKSLVRALPVVSIAVGAGVNKVLTARVGKRCVEELAHRRELDDAHAKKAPPVKARVGPTREEP